MLGSFQDAEDAVQETLLAAWRGLGGFIEERASLRTWLYKIATNRCLNAMRAARRRPAKEWDVPDVEPPEPSRLGEVVWLQPYPDDLGYHASEVAEMLEVTVESVNSVLKRARASLQRVQGPAGADRRPPPAAGSPAEEAIVAKFVRAYESADIETVVAMLTDDAFVSMPPLPFEYEGRDVVTRFLAIMLGPGRGVDLVPTKANGQPAFGVYRRAATGPRL